MAYTPEGSGVGWIQQPTARWGAAARGGQGLWSLVDHGLALTLPTSIVAVGCGGGAGAPHGSLAALRLCGGAHGGAQPRGQAMAFGEAPGTALGGLPPSHLETPQHKPALWKHLNLQASTKHSGPPLQTTQHQPHSALGT